MGKELNIALLLHEVKEKQALELRAGPLSLLLHDLVGLVTQLAAFYRVEG